MKHVEIWLWLIRDAVTEKLRVSRHRMTADDAEAMHRGAQRLPGSMELREVAQSRDAELSDSLDSWMRGAEAAPETGAPN